ncbi:MAG: hypothetical protein HMLKMBBP_00575 [Planctomycetes bacterium]|nr:hypothetical protein [Planctomycetota bacterium]
MRTRSWLARLSAAAAVSATAAGVAAGSGEDRPAPVLLGFSPAAIHAGDLMVLDADLGGERGARVWIGGRKLPRRRVQVERRDGGAGVLPAPERLWVSVPRRLPAGSHEVALTTRAGRAAAAKRVEVIDCDPPDEPIGDCGGTLSSGVSIDAEGTGYDVRFTSAGPADLYPLPSQSVVELEKNAGQITFGFQIDTAPSALESGDADAVQFHLADYTGGFRGYWSRDAGTVRIVDTSATRVLICVDTTLTADGMFEPATLRVRGFVVVRR